MGYNSVAMEAHLINDAILNQDNLLNGEDLKEDGEVDRRFGFPEMMKFKYAWLMCCHRKQIESDPRFKVLEQCEASLNNKMDLITIIKNVNMMNAISLAILEPYQIRILPYLSKNVDQPTDYEGDDGLKHLDFNNKMLEADSMSLAEAIKNCHQNKNSFEKGSIKECYNE